VARIDAIDAAAVDEAAVSTGIRSQGQQYAACAQPTPSIFPHSPPPSDCTMAATGRTLFATSA